MKEIIILSPALLLSIISQLWCLLGIIFICLSDPLILHTGVFWWLLCWCLYCGKSFLNIRLKGLDYYWWVLESWALSICVHWIFYG